MNSLNGITIGSRPVTGKSAFHLRRDPPQAWTIIGRRTSEDGAELTVTSLSFGATAEEAIQHWLDSVQPTFRRVVGEQPLHVYARHEITAEPLV